MHHARIIPTWMYMNACKRGISHKLPPWRPTVKYTTQITAAIESAMRRTISLFEQYVKLLPVSETTSTLIATVRMQDPAMLTDTIAANLQLAIEEKQKLLEIFNPAERLNRIADVLDIEIEKLNLDRTIESRVKRQMERDQKEHYLIEKVKAIQKELGRGLRTGPPVGLKLADGNVIQGKLASIDANGVWLEVDKSSWVVLAGPRVQYPFEKHTGTLRCFVPSSSMAWLMTTNAMGSSGQSL
jgi:hypothetical protein